MQRNVIDVKHLPYAVKIRLIHTSINKRKRSKIHEKFFRISLINFKRVERRKKIALVIYSRLQIYVFVFPPSRFKHVLKSQAREVIEK